VAEATKAMDAALFDRRGYPTTSTEAGYDEWADTYEASVATGLDTLLLPQLRSITWRQIETVADLGCGTGRTGDWLKARGVGAIDGVDLSPTSAVWGRRMSIFKCLAWAVCTTF
jgi:predicted TPR repeat methyltransferase